MAIERANDVRWQLMHIAVRKCLESAPPGAMAKAMTSVAFADPHLDVVRPFASLHSIAGDAAETVNLAERP